MILTGATIPKITFKRRSATLDSELLGQYIAKGAPKRTRKYIVPSWYIAFDNPELLSRGRMNTFDQTSTKTNTSNASCESDVSNAVPTSGFNFTHPWDPQTGKINMTFIRDDTRVKTGIVYNKILCGDL